VAFELPRDLSWAYRELGIDLPKLNQSERFELPVPATFVVSAAEETSAAPPECVPTAPRVHLRRDHPGPPIGQSNIRAATLRALDPARMRCSERERVARRRRAAR